MSLAVIPEMILQEKCHNLLAFILQVEMSIKNALFTVEISYQQSLSDIFDLGAKEMVPVQVAFVSHQIKALIVY